VVAPGAPSRSAASGSRHGEALLRMNATPAELAAHWLAPVMSVR